MAPPRAPERRQLTFVFADVVGSTELADRLDPEDVHLLLSRFRDIVRAVVDRFGGHAAGFPGDGAVAVFGWHAAFEESAERAARAAVAINAEVADLRDVEGVALAVRVGVATGLVVVEGGEGRTEDFVGAAPNLAARLQSVGRPGEAVVSELTRALIGRRFETEALDPVALRGFREPVAAFRLVRERTSLTRFEARDADGDRSPLLGRAAELEALEALWARAERGEGGGVRLAGQAGIGKSRLAEALAERARARGARLVRLQAAEGREASPLWPLRRAIAAEAGLDPDADRADRRLALDAWLSTTPGLGRLGPGLVADLLDLATPGELPEIGAARRRELLLDALAAVLLAEAARRPLLLLFEDLHWIDPSSLDLLRRLLAEAPRAPLLVVATTRPEGAPELQEIPAAERLVLEALPAEVAERLVRARASGARLDDETVAAIVARAEGVPLYVEETTAAVLNGAASAEAVPATLRESLAARLDRLGPARETAQVAAAVGRDVDLDLLVALSDPARVAADAACLVDAGLARAREGGFVFSHALVQDAAYQSLLRGRRRELHGRIAEAMLGRFRRRFADEPETLAHHLERAGRTAAAVDYYLRAADVAGLRAANREAEGYATRALALAETLDGGAERDRREIAALLALGRISTALRGYGRAETERPLRRALDLARAADMPRTEFPLVVGLAAQAAVSGDGVKSLTLAARSEELAAASDDPTHRVMAAYATGLARCWRGERDLAAELFEVGAAAYDPAMHARLLTMGPQDPGLVCIARGASNRFHVDLDPAQCGRIDEAVELARRLGHAHTLNYMLHWKAMQAVDAGDWPRAEAAIDETVAFAEEQGFATWRSLGLLSAARLAAETATPAEALSAAKTALALLPEAGNVCAVSHVRGLVGEALRRLRRTAEAMEALNEAVAEAEAGAMRWGLVHTLRVLARCRIDVDGGTTAGAEAALARAVSLARRQRSRLLELRATCDLAELLIAQGDRPAAEAALGPVLGTVPTSPTLADRRRAEAILAAAC